MARQEPFPNKQPDARRDIPQPRVPVAGDGLTPPDQATEGLAREAPECEPGRAAERVPMGSRPKANCTGPADDLGMGWGEMPAVDDEMSREPPEPGKDTST
jgi:hypothetical protein